MLSIFADAMMRASGQRKWDAPDHWTNHRAPRSNAQMEREAEEWRRHAYRDIGLW